LQPSKIFASVGAPLAAPENIANFGRSKRHPYNQRKHILDFEDSPYDGRQFEFEDILGGD